jgi:NADH:ubiquinone oxidoreductase subunit 6 (subunit J)
LLNAQFLAMVHVIVYTGAIMVLILFVIMLLNMNTVEPKCETGGHAHPRGSHGRVACSFWCFWRPSAADFPSQVPANEFDPGIGLVRIVGMSLFTGIPAAFRAEQRALPERHGRRGDAGEEGRHRQREPAAQQRA